MRCTLAGEVICLGDAPEDVSGAGACCGLFACSIDPFGEDGADDVTAAVSFTVEGVGGACSDVEAEISSKPTAFLIDWMLSVAVLSNAAGDISDVAVFSSSSMFVANLDKLLSIALDALGPVFLGLGVFLVFWGAFCCGFGAGARGAGAWLFAGGAGREAGFLAGAPATRLFSAFASASVSFERASDMVYMGNGYNGSMPRKSDHISVSIY